MAKIPLSQPVLLAHRVFSVLAFGLFSSVLEVTLSVPIANKIAKKKHRSSRNETRERKNRSERRGNKPTEDVACRGRTHLSQVQHSHISFPSPKKLAP